MSIRFIDVVKSMDNRQLASGQSDFVVRKRRPLWQGILGVVFAVLPISIALSFIVVNTVIFTVVLFAILSIVAAYLFITIQRSRDLVLATEFQNALFSSALGYSNKFCLIVKNDGTIVYIDRSFQELFPSFYKETRRSIDVLLEYGKVSKDERKIIFSAIEKRIHSKVVFDLIDAKNHSHRIMMSIEPIARPSGFILLRGREFVEKRVLSTIAADNSKGQMFAKPNMEMFSYITDSMDIGCYVVDLYGAIIYANLTLEQWLDFDEGEIVSNNIYLKDIISQTNLSVYVSDFKNFEGEVLLTRKIGGYIQAFINQKAIYADDGTIIAYTALVQRQSQNKETISNKQQNW